MTNASQSVVTTNMSFGQAIEFLKQGRNVQRAGWNGKGTYIYLVELAGCDPCIGLFTAQGTYQPGWNASTPDVLADDWALLQGV